MKIWLMKIIVVVSILQKFYCILTLLIVINYFIYIIYLELKYHIDQVLILNVHHPKKTIQKPKYY